MVVPPGNTEGASLVMVYSPQLSVTVGVPRLTFETVVEPTGAVRLIFGGVTAEGYSTSLTVTSNDNDELPQVLTAVVKTVVVPT